MIILWLWILEVEAWDVEDLFVAAHQLTSVNVEKLKEPHEERNHDWLWEAEDTDD